MKNSILIVDDNKLNRSALSDILSSEYKIIEAENGLEALNKLNVQGDDVALIILDLVMPIMGGFEFLQEIKKEERLKDIPIIVATAEDDVENEKKCLAAGVWDFIPKSFHSEIIQFRVINTIKRSEAHLMEIDPLTNLYNVQKFRQATRELLEKNPNQKFAFERIDIERFKMINSFYGTAEGDRLICYLADTIKTILKSEKQCTYGRINADVFGVCVPDNMDKIRDYELLVKEQLKAYKAPYYLEAVTGVYEIEDNNMEMSKIFDYAAIAANQCKGKYMVHEAVYTREMGEKLIREQKVMNEMDHALEANEFVVYFQPKYELTNYGPSGAEALVRWRKPDGTMVSPGEFIPIFESNGFITKLDYYVWEKVCQFIRHRLDQGKSMEPISVNVSRVNLYNPQFLESLVNLVEKYKISPRYLNLELTESAFSDDEKMIQTAVDYLHKAGFTIMMDDFGSGFSSLNVLKDINLDVLKIDMKFLSKGPSESRCEKILEAVIKMAESLEMPVIAEGVEEEKQVNLLKRLGCDYIQGYYFARPMPVEDYIEVIENV